jgi:hypothetical protein
MKLYELQTSTHNPDHVRYDVVAIDESANTYEIAKIAISEGEQTVYIKIREK